MVAFDRHEVVRAVVLMDLAQGFLAGVQGVEHDQFAVQRTEFCQQGARGGDFVALVFDGDGAQDASGGQALGADELGLLLVLDMRGAAALGLAVDGDLVVLGLLPGALDFPLDEHALEGLGIDLGQHALEGGFLRIIPSAVALAIAAQRAQLGLGELGGEGGQVALAAHDARQSGHDHDGQQAGQRIVAAFFARQSGTCRHRTMSARSSRPWLRNGE